MRVRRHRPGTLVVELLCLVTIGCSAEEEAPMDPGVSPFYPGPAATAKTSTGPAAARGPIAGGVSASRIPAIGTGADLDGSSASEDSIQPEDTERQLRVALRTVERGDPARGAKTLDRILTVQPLHREALIARASIAMMDFEKATAPAERAAALEKATVLIRTLHRAYEIPKKAEAILYANVLYALVQSHVAQGQFAKAAAILREAHDAGIDAFGKIEQEEAMASFRKSPEFRTLITTLDAEDLARARQEVKPHFIRPLGFSFDFKLNDVDGKPLSLDQLKGKVVLVDIWGTWCGPCREAIPGLIQLYHKHHRRGFDIVGLSFEKAPNPEEARAMVKKAIQGAGIPYHCALGNEEILKQIPDYNGTFPTTLVLDRSGKVRLLNMENSKEFGAMLDPIIQVLAAEPVPPAPARAADAGAAKKSKEPPATRANEPAAPAKDAVKPK